jgi:hypothetical protein
MQRVSLTARWTFSAARTVTHEDENEAYSRPLLALSLQFSFNAPM